MKQGTGQGTSKHGTPAHGTDVDPRMALPRRSVAGSLAAATSAILVCAVTIGATHDPARAAGADAEPRACAIVLPVEHGDGVAVHWSETGALLLADGRRLVPDGIVLPTRISAAPAVLRAAEAAAATVIEGMRVHPGAERADRHGRLTGDAALAAQGGAAGEDLATALLRAGAGFAEPAGDAACGAERLAAEAEAQQQRRGIWAQPGTILKAADETGLLRRAGLFTLVQGRVRAVGVTRERVYLNFGATWRQDFTVILPKEDFAIILGDSLDPAMLRGTMVRVRGVVRVDGGPAVQLRRTGEILRVAGTETVPPQRPARRNER